MLFSNVTLNTACRHSCIRFSDHVLIPLTNTQKKVFAVATCIFGLFAICYVIHKVWMNPHLTKVVKANEPLKQEQPSDEQLQEQVPMITPTVPPSIRGSEINFPRQDSETTESNGKEEEVTLPLDGKIIPKQDDDLLPSWINDQPDVSLIDHGLSHFPDLLEYLQKYGSQLHCLNLTGLAIDDVQFSELIQLCPSLDHLKISSFNITDGALAHLQGLKLTHANFFRCVNLTDGALAHLQGMPLKSIDFSFCNNLTDAAFDYLQGMSLTSINFNYCENLTDAVFHHLRNMPLESVSFAGCKKLTDKAFAHLRGMQLTSVNFAGCKNLSDTALACLQGMQLTCVNFMVCNRITDAGLGYLQGMPLETTDFRGCNKISKLGLLGLNA